jgi:tRNA U34 5-carboxymethylaminomethyl modifying GTPase MnmE/TrmE
MGDKPFIVVDTGGFEPVAAEGIMSEMARQAREAIAEADVVIFVVDGRAGLSPQDKRIAQQLRESSAPVMLAVNKTEGMRRGDRDRGIPRARDGRAARDLRRARRGRARADRDGARPFKLEPEEEKSPTTRAWPSSGAPTSASPRW